MIKFRGLPFSTVALAFFLNFPARADGIQASDPRIQVLGRSSSSLAGTLRFDWPGTGLAFRFEGGPLTLKLSGEGLLYNLSIDEGPGKILKSKPGQVEWAVASPGPGPHSLRLTRRQDGNSGISTFSGIALAEGTHLLEPAPRPTRRVELFGDSFTAGYGVEGLSLTCDDTPSTHNADLAYGSLLGRRLGAEIRLTAISGRGLVRNYGDKKTASSDPLGPWAFRSCQNLEETLAPDGWIPDGVVVCLGGNDYSTQPWPEDGKFLAAYKDLVQAIRSRYPKVPLLLLVDTGEAPAQEALAQVVKEARQGGPVETTSLPALDKSLLGCDWHPNIQGQALIAQTLEPSLRKLLGL